MSQSTAAQPVCDKGNVQLNLIYDSDMDITFFAITLYLCGDFFPEAMQ